MSYQDAIDIVTPLVLIPLYWLMYKKVSRGEPGLTSEITFMLFSALWVAGQGMHLSANSINNLIGHLGKNQGFDVAGTELYTLTYFYDEFLSHYLWHIGVVGLAGLLIFESWKYPVDVSTNWGLVIPAGVLYGFTLFCIFLEGNTLFLGIPFSLVVFLLIVSWGRMKSKQQPVLAFFFTASTSALILFVGWRLYWGSFIPIMEAIQF